MNKIFENDDVKQIFELNMNNSFLILLQNQLNNIVYFLQEIANVLNL